MSEIKVRGPKGCGKTLSHGGEVYTADKKGFFTVPSEAAEALKLHGFVAQGDEEVETEEERAAREAAEAEAAAAAEAAKKAEEEAAAAAAAAAGNKP